MKTQLDLWCKPSRELLSMKPPLPAILFLHLHMRCKLLGLKLRALYLRNHSERSRNLCVWCKYWTVSITLCQVGLSLWLGGEDCMRDLKWVGSGISHQYLCVLRGKDLGGRGCFVCLSVCLLSVCVHMYMLHTYICTFMNACIDMYICTHVFHTHTSKLADVPGLKLPKHYTTKN